MLITLIILLALGGGIYLFLQKPVFGAAPSGARLEKVKNSPNYKNGKFQNLSPTSVMQGSFFSSMRDYLFKKSKRRKPDSIIPSVKTDLLNLPQEQDVLIWFGHSSYFIQLNGKRFLIDPVFTKKGSLSWFINKPMPGSNVYTPQEMPEIDYLFISHNHWDHLDYNTALALKPKIKRVITPLGAGANFERWGFGADIIEDLDWYEEYDGPGVKITALPARHFSGRTGHGNKALWASYLVQSGGFKFYIGGDSGYDTFFAQIGQKYGPIDLVMLDDGQYDKNWESIHMLPEQGFQAAKDLRAQTYFPVHNSKFILSVHAWDAPLIRVTEANKNNDLRIITPMIGEVVYIKDKNQTFSKWWESVK